MIRDWLISWLLRSRGLCRVGLHMPVTPMVFDENDRLVESPDYHCAVCETNL